MIDGRDKAIIVEDHALTRTLLKSFVESMDFEVFTASDASHAMALVRRHEPTLLITDLDLGLGPTGVQLANWAEKHTPAPGIILITAFRSTLLVDPKELPPNPRRRHLVKDEVLSDDVLREAVAAVLSGEPVEATPRPELASYEITRDQADVLRLMARGLSNSEIAVHRDSSMSAVENMARRIYATLGLAGDDSINPRAAAIAMYQRSQISVH